MSRIHRLPEGVVNRIAAGEVVERPASVVRELMENALDAGARHIDVRIEDGGRTHLVVSDDGSGMSAEDLALCVERHATSKLPEDADSAALQAVKTLGFRGEALPSIGAVGRLVILSRTKESETAMRISVDFGRRTQPQPTAGDVGTRVQLSDIFRATPARLKFMKSPRAEAGAISDVVRRHAMASPHVAFTLQSGSGRILRYPQRDTHKARLADVMGADFVANAVEVEAERDQLSLRGFAGLPTWTRPSALWQYVFVNARPVRDRVLAGAVRAAYADLIARDKHPALALFLEVAPDYVDVNVHPAKAEVRFRDAGAVRGTLIHALKEALSGAGYRASATLAGRALGAMTPHTTMPARASPQALRDVHAPYVASAAQPRLALPAHGGASARIPDAPAPVQDSEAQALPLGVARGHLHETYIIAQTADGIVIVDQHAAHERIVHEDMKRQLAETGVARQVLLVPEVVELTEAEAEALIGKADEIAELGFVFERYGAATIIVREVPAMCKNLNLPALVRDLADDISTHGAAFSLKERLEEVSGTIACHTSIRAGARLSGDEMNALLRLMEKTPHAGQCNHGRPTYVELKRADIEKLFGRR